MPVPSFCSFAIESLHQPSSANKPGDKDTSEERPITSKDKPLPDVIELSSSDTPPPPPKKNEEVKKEDIKDDIERVPAEHLPSHREAQRWDFSKRFQDFMDDLLPKLAVVTQKVNTYTGTDYSGIAALKREIKEQEKLVKTRRAAIEEAKQALDAALSQQASSQKEVVALLERKHSWSATDLERYMSLIRSEHVNDQAVREAKEAIALAENALEEARSQLERRERAQYHEEQIWSDTIRRNSTWVTFGLMGLNIFLLLVTMIVIEPWRRRRMVREIKTALEAQKAAIEPAAASPVSSALPAEPIAAIPAVAPRIEKATEMVENISSNSFTTEPADSAPPIQQDAEVIIGETTEAPSVVLNSSAEAAGASSVEPVATPVAEEEVVPLKSVHIEEEIRNSTTLETWQEKVTYVVKDIISERAISMRRIDYTTAILQSAAAGAVITAAIVAMVLRR
ncbi:sensitivity to high expression protein she9 [Kalmusia sp. IMI 367209]|nr:sensitivity to high expression protein she9 [Kalmusia sp. IMI 367209]